MSDNFHRRLNNLEFHFTMVIARICNLTKDEQLDEELGEIMNGFLGHAKELGSDVMTIVDKINSLAEAENEQESKQQERTKH